MTPPDENEVSIVHKSFVGTMKKMSEAGKTADERRLAEILLGLYLEVQHEPAAIRYVNRWASEVMERNCK